MAETTAFIGAVLAYVFAAALLAGVCKRLGWLEPGYNDDPSPAWGFLVALWPIGWLVVLAYWGAVHGLGPPCRALYRLTAGTPPDPTIAKIEQELTYELENPDASR